MLTTAEALAYSNAAADRSEMIERIYNDIRRNGSFDSEREDMARAIRIADGVLDTEAAGPTDAEMM